MVTEARLEAHLRELLPQVLGALTRRTGDFDRSEDAVSEAMLAAAQQWRAEGVPADPRAWLVTIASRRLTDMWRSESARRRRELRTAEAEERLTAPVEYAADDTADLLFLCCHPDLSPASQVALTLRAVGGLTTAEIAAAFLVPADTMTRRISRAKRAVAAAGGGFGVLDAATRAARLPSVLRVLYLIFNEGYAPATGAELARVELSAEAIRLTRQLRESLPEQSELAGLLALMLLTDARRPARLDADGRLVPLEAQDRRLWRYELVDEGVAILTDVLPRPPTGPYQLQAAIAAVHDEAEVAQDTDWPQILGLYHLLERMDPSPMAQLGRVVALAMVQGPRAGLAACEELAGELGDHHRWFAVRAHLLEDAGEAKAAVRAYREAAQRTASLPERDYLTRRADRLGSDPD
ncbi:sigma-70 family RNA polymerase sigma factor [Streptomyces sp. B5E4]|uniref:RNA polymerase sigma factor n=1 Tax=Streptomyces sp. B5E4 TaxID=3153568 RepID=UPI00325CCA1F